MIFIFVPGYCKWIGLILGFVFRRFAGAIAGYFLGAFIDSLWKNSSVRFTYGAHTHTYGRQQATPPPRQSSLQDAYDELGISPTATDDEVRAAYKRVALLYHPDRVAGMGEEMQRNAAEQMKAVNEAYEVIKQRRPNLK